MVEVNAKKFYRDVLHYTKNPVPNIGTSSELLSPLHKCNVFQRNYCINSRTRRLATTAHARFICYSSVSFRYIISGIFYKRAFLFVFLSFSLTFFLPTFYAVSCVLPHPPLVFISWILNEICHSTKPYFSVPSASIEFQSTKEEFCRSL